MATLSFFFFSENPAVVDIDGNNLNENKIGVKNGGSGRFWQIWDIQSSEKHVRVTIKSIDRLKT